LDTNKSLIVAKNKNQDNRNFPNIDLFFFNELYWSIPQDVFTKFSTEIFFIIVRFFWNEIDNVSKNFFYLIIIEIANAS